MGTSPETRPPCRVEPSAPPLTAEDCVRARRLLIRRDPILGAIIKQAGPCGLDVARHPDHLSAFVRAIVGQQLSAKAAATIHARLVALFPQNRVTLEALSRVDDGRLRRVGLSARKIGYLRGLCSRIAGGQLRLDDLDTRPDEDVIEQLVRVKGFGRWTAEMFLIFRLQRPDILPVGDLGICRAVERLYNLRARPTPKRLLKIGEAWRPYRSVACWYLWQSLRNEPGL